MSSLASSTKPKKYRRLKRIGKGSFGIVDLIKDTRDGKLYVMKTVSVTGPDRAGARKAHQEALREARFLSKLKHPNIVAFIEAFEAKNGTRLCIVMAYCESGDLGMRLTRAREKRLLFSELTIMEWFIQMVLALHYLHQNHVLHRDLKPQNIFLTENNKVVKLGDFGVTRTLENTLSMAMTQVGTPYYMSPELAQNKPYNAKADVWALGCILYEMAALQVPFPARNFATLVECVITRDPAKLPSAYPKKLTVLIRGMMRKDPNRRASIDQVIRHPYVQTHLDLFAKRYSGEDNDRNIATTINGDDNTILKDKLDTDTIDMKTKQNGNDKKHQINQIIPVDRKTSSLNEFVKEKIITVENETKEYNDGQQLEKDIQEQEKLLNRTIKNRQKAKDSGECGAKRNLEMKEEEHEIRETVGNLEKEILEHSVNVHENAMIKQESEDMQRTMELLLSIRDLSDSKAVETTNVEELRNPEELNTNVETNTEDSSVIRSEASKGNYSKEAKDAKSNDYYEQVVEVIGGIDINEDE